MDKKEKQFYNYWSGDPIQTGSIEVQKDKTEYTVPDQSYTIRQLFDKFARTQSLPVSQKDEDFDLMETDPDDFDAVNPLDRAIDMTDVDDMARELQMRKDFSEAKRPIERSGKAKMSRLNLLETEASPELGDVGHVAAVENQSVKVTT